jgi:hypothetical protein
MVVTLLKVIGPKLTENGLPEPPPVTPPAAASVNVKSSENGPSALNNPANDVGVDVLNVPSAATDGAAVDAVAAAARKIPSAMRFFKTILQLFLIPAGKEHTPPST